MSGRERQNRLPRRSIIGLGALVASVPLVVRGVMIHRDQPAITVGYPGAGVLALGALLALVATCLGAFGYRLAKLDDERVDVPSLARSLVGLAVLGVALRGLIGVVHTGGGN